MDREDFRGACQHPLRSLFVCVVPRCMSISAVHVRTFRGGCARFRGGCQFLRGVLLHMHPQRNFREEVGQIVFRARLELMKNRTWQGRRMGSPTRMNAERGKSNRPFPQLPSTKMSSIYAAVLRITNGRNIATQCITADLAFVIPL